MIFISRKGQQSTPSSVALEEAEDTEIGEEEVNVGTRIEQVEEASNSRWKSSKLDELLTKFEEFKAQTQMNFEALKHQLQSTQAENLSNFGTIGQLLEGIQVQIQTMQRQLSPLHLSTPTAATTPINSPTDDYGPEP